MSEQAHAASDVTALADIAAPGRLGRSAGPAGVTLSLIRGAACAMVIQRKGQQAALAAAARKAFGCEPPHAPACVGGAVRFAGIAPGQWLALRAGSDDGVAFEQDLRAVLAGTASISDQTDARVGIRAGGARVRDMLAKLCPVDLDDRAFPAGRVASTLFGHISGAILRPDQSPAFEIFVSRSFALAFWRGMVAAGTEFGIDVV